MFSDDAASTGTYINLLSDFSIFFFTIIPIILILRNLEKEVLKYEFNILRLLSYIISILIKLMYLKIQILHL